MKHLFCLGITIFLLFNVHAQDINPRLRIDNNQRPFSTLTDNTKLMVVNYKPVIAAEQKSVLDSIVRHKYEKASKSWAPDYIIKYEYNEFGELTLNEYQGWDKLNEIWLNGYKWEYTYTDHLLQNSTKVSWDNYSQDWKMEIKKEFVYDEQKNLIEQIDYSFNTGSNEFNYSYKDVHTYNSSGQNTTNTFYQWDVENWRKVSLWENNYDNQGLLSKQIGYQWRSKMNSWVVASKYEYEYWNSQIINRLRIDFDFQNNQWDSVENYHYKYDEIGDLVYLLYSNFNESIFAWDTISWVEHTYNELGNLVNSNRNYGTKNIISDSLSYNNTVSFEELLVPWQLDYDPTMFNHQLVRYSQGIWDETDSTYTPSSVQYYYFENKLIEGVKIYAKEEVKMYPNPASSTVVFELPEETVKSNISIYSLSGALLISKYILNKKELFIENLLDGVYIVKIQLNDDIYITKKLVINKN